MSISLDQLRSALTEHADATGPTVPDRLGGVRRLVAARRRRRAAITTGALVVMLVATAGVGLQARRSATPAPPAANPNPVVNGLPEYDAGGRQIGSAEVAVQLGTDPLFVATPTSYDLQFTATCTSAGEGTTYVVVVNGHSGLGSSCGADDITSNGSGLVGAAETWAPLGIHVGQPVRIGVRVTHRDPSARADATISVALYQRIPRSAYPYPKPPAHVQPPTIIAYPLTEPIAVQLGESGADPSAGQRQHDDHHAVRQRPGGRGHLLGSRDWCAILVDGRLIGGYESWDYTPESWTVGLDPATLQDVGVHPRAGESITFTVEFNGFAQPDWKVELGHDPSG